MAHTVQGHQLVPALEAQLTFTEISTDPGEAEWACIKLQ